MQLPLHLGLDHALNLENLSFWSQPPKKESCLAIGGDGDSWSLDPKIAPLSILIVSPDPTSSTLITRGRQEQHHNGERFIHPASPHAFTATIPQNNSPGDFTRVESLTFGATEGGRHAYVRSSLRCRVHTPLIRFLFLACTIASTIASATRNAMTSATRSDKHSCRDRSTLRDVIIRMQREETRYPLGPHL